VCLILFHFEPDSPQPLLVAANRDEFYARPALAAHYWDDNPDIFAGRDLTAGGSWLGVNRNGRFAALTNFSAGDQPRDYPASRGELVTDFLASKTSARDFVTQLSGRSYAGFNLLVYDGSELYYTTNKDFPNQQIPAGTYGLSNAEFSASWPKVQDGARDLSAALQGAQLQTPLQNKTQKSLPKSPGIPALLAVLGDDTPPSDDRIPARSHLEDTPIETRRALAARFIAGVDYGTRAMTLVTVSTNHTDVFEQQLGAGGIRGSAVFARVPRTPAQE